MCRTSTLNLQQHRQSQSVSGDEPGRQPFNHTHYEASLDADGKLPSILLPHQEGPVGPRQEQVFGCSSVHVSSEPWITGTVRNVSLSF